MIFRNFSSARFKSRFDQLFGNERVGSFRNRQVEEVAEVNDLLVWQVELLNGVPESAASVFCAVTVSGGVFGCSRNARINAETYRPSNGGGC
ncbi:MAG: hypothetical protein U0X87_18065 [Anaerolineales bacterium]